MKRTTGGEIVQVEGGHIIRSTGRKDRHSKVYTTKGPRDRRVRLSAHTAIRFYDVQDRLGYDRPSKAMDWLIKKAKIAIDKLNELPPWNPNQDVANNLATSDEIHVGSSGNYVGLEPYEPLSNSSSRLLFQGQLEEIPNSSYSYYMISQPATERQSVTDTSKSFFPMNSTTSLTSFPNFPHDIVMSRDSIQANDDQDLGLSLHTNLHDQKYTNHSPNNPILRFEPTYDNGHNNDSRIANWIIPHQQCLVHGEPLQSNLPQLIHHAWEQRLMTSNNQEHYQSSISNSYFNGDFQFHGEEVNGVVVSSSHH